MWSRPIASRQTGTTRSAARLLVARRPAGQGEHAAAVRRRQQIRHPSEGAASRRHHGRRLRLRRFPHSRLQDCPRSPKLLASVNPGEGGNQQLPQVAMPWPLRGGGGAGPTESPPFESLGKAALAPHFHLCPGLRQQAAQIETRHQQTEHQFWATSGMQMPPMMPLLLPCPRRAEHHRAQVTGPVPQSALQHLLVPRLPAMSGAGTGPSPMLPSVKQASQPPPHHACQPFPRRARRASVRYR